VPSHCLCDAAGLDSPDHDVLPGRSRRELLEGSRAGCHLLSGCNMHHLRCSAPVSLGTDSSQLKRGEPWHAWSIGGQGVNHWLACSLRANPAAAGSCMVRHLLRRNVREWSPSAAAAAAAGPKAVKGCPARRKRLRKRDSCHSYWCCAAMPAICIGICSASPVAPASVFGLPLNLQLFDKCWRTMRGICFQVCCIAARPPHAPCALQELCSCRMLLRDTSV